MSVVVFSGGLDSTVLLTQAAFSSAQQPVALSFDYGQRHIRELEAAATVAEALALPHQRVDLAGLGALLTGSALTDPDVAVPDGHYAEASMRATIVPNRNAVMIALAAAYAVAHGHREVIFGAHAGDHYIYPDCRPEFIHAIDQAMRLANDGVAEIAVRAPFAEMTKTDIVALGHQIRAPMGLSWSCYNGRERHCGSCGTCTERREAFAQVGIADPTAYEQLVAP